MQSHRTVLVAASLSVLALLAVWVMFKAPHSAPVPPASDADTAHVADQPATPEPGDSRQTAPDWDPDYDPDDEGYKAPFDDGYVGMRVQLWDADADEPLRRMPCDEGVSFRVNWRYTAVPERDLFWDRRFATDNGETTDDDGVVEASVSPWSMALPVPLGWHLWSSATAVFRELAGAYSIGTSAPIRVNLRRSAELELVVLDAEGRPVSNERVSLAWDALSSRAPLDEVRWAAMDDEEEPGRVSPDHWFGGELPGVKLRMGRWHFGDDAVYHRGSSNPTSSLSGWTDRAGMVRATGMLPDRFELVVGGERFTGVIELVPGENRHVVELDTLRDNLINLRVEWHGPDAERPRDLGVGIIAWRDDGPIKPSLSESFAADRTSTVLYDDTITGIPDGLWLVYADGGDVGEGRLIDLRGGEEQSVTLNVGPATAATLELEFVYEGVRLAHPVGTLTQLSGTTMDLGEGSQARDSTWRLPSGPYVLNVPGMPPRRLDLGAGQARKETIRIPSVAVTVSVSAELRQLLAPEDGVLWFSLQEKDNDQKRFTFEIDDAFAESEEHEGMAALPDDAEITPGWRLEFRSPAGTYDWVLAGEANLRISGPITLSALRPPVLNLDLRNLPGLEVLELTLPGFDDDNPPLLSVLDPADQDAQALPSVHHRLVSLAATAPQMLDLGEGRRLVVGPPGNLIVQVECVARGRSVQRLVTLPGRAQIASSELDYSVSRLELVGEARFRRVWIQGFHEGVGDVLLGLGVNDVPQGRIELRVHRRSQSLGDDVDEVAVHVIEISRDRHKLDLDSLEYVQCGDAEVRVMFPPSVRLEREYDGAPMLYALESLSRSFNGQPLRWSARSLRRHIISADPYRIEVEFRGFLPGSYRIIPWEGAQAADWVEFTIEPGRTVRVE